MSEQKQNPNQKLNPNQNQFDMLHGGAAPHTAARNQLLPEASFAHEVASELGIDPDRVAQLTGVERNKIKIIEEEAHSRA